MARCSMHCILHKRTTRKFARGTAGQTTRKPLLYREHEKSLPKLNEKKENGDTINSDITREDGPFLFHIEDQVGDSVIVKFADDKCLTYTDNLDNPNNKIFNIDDYDNFDTRLIETGERYNLYYTFTEEDYNLAVDCE